MKAFLFAILGTLSLATWASASIVSFSATIPTRSASFTDLFNLTKFDTNLGTLTGVTLELDPSGAAVERVLNLTGSNATYSDAITAFPFTLTGPDGTFVQVLLTAGPFSGTALPGFNSNPGNSVSGAFTTNVSNLNWANYEGTGVQPLALTAAIDGGTSSGTPGAPGFIGFGGAASAGGTATVIYSFDATPVPEPGTLALLGSALLGLGAIRRRRKA